ncbi:hypothetical protein BDV38DRAFT_262394 [Aspergillus pseudotamarii]|uniref:Zn(2)-C6 fungal-type domain-containing protein n=1 Tax=Aspergillus pseudotamarii TaxID=132259 RepID=A0A5N6SBE1_ASPPS|nr:uncharacterized protein BDV38DRAFT_262394 [Aspergillus pseudotamarii]KAE8132032.1 hypothetical protein BDV38DRAFT_262394 [Aspergillus pseudotamarii]
MSATWAQSYRTSCDRCRSQKLRCVPSLNGDCQRCMRARMPCVFSRRARSGRQPKRVNHVEGTPPTDSSGSSADDPLASIIRVDPLTDPSLGTIFAEILLDHSGTTPVLPVHMPYPGWKAGWWYASESPGSDFDLDKAANMLDQQNFDHGDRSHSKAVPSISSSDPLGDSQTSSAQVHGLSSILVAMTNYKGDLHYYRTTAIDAKHNSSSSIYDYPIGGATSLAQSLRELVSRQTWQHSELSHQDPALEKTIDTPTLLLMLSCYISLINIYDTVICDLQRLLALLPAATLSRPESQWGLRLGDLPLTNDGCVRTLNAVQILLDALNAIENDLEHVKDLNDNMLESLFRRDTSTGTTFEKGISSGLRVKIEQLQGKLKHNLNL